MSGVRATLMRGGTSKGLYLEAADLPADPERRDDLVRRLLGSPDPRQIDGLGGAHPLTSKVALVSPSADPHSDVDYLFLQVTPETGVVSDRQNCGNLLAGVGPFALERGLVPARPGRTEVRIRLVNTGGRAVATIATPGGRVSYAGDTALSGVPGSAAPVALAFVDTAGSTCGALLPTGAARDEVGGVPVTLVDGGMPVVVVAAAALGVSGYGSPAELEADTALRELVERLRRAAGPLMGLGDVSGATVPKVTLVARPRTGGTLATRTFAPHRCHPSIGVLGAVSVAAAAALPGSVAHEVAVGPPRRIEHPSGFIDVHIDGDRVAVVSTARRLFDGTAWPAPEGVP